MAAFIGRREFSTLLGLTELGQGVIAQAIIARRKCDDVLDDCLVGAVTPFFRPKRAARASSRASVIVSKVVAATSACGIVRQTPQDL